MNFMMTFAPALFGVMPSREFNMAV